MISQFGVFTSYQVNVDANGNNIVGDAANECVHFRRSDGWQQDDNRLEAVQQRYLQLPAGRLGLYHRCRHTLDVSRVLENNVFRSDPVTKSDETGNFFYLSLQSTEQQSFFCDDLWRSTNGGQSWTLLSGDEARAEATRNGSPSIRPTARVMDSSTSFGPAYFSVRRRAISTVPPTAGSPGMSSD